MIKLAIRLVFAIALVGFSSKALVGTAYAEDKKEEKTDKTDKDSKKKKEKKGADKEGEKGGW